MYDVLIIGCGPVGATLACLLGQAGHKVAVAEMHKEVYDKPRAINLDQEALRLWQQIGIAHEVAKGCAPHPGTDFVGIDGKPIKSIYSAPPPYPLGWPSNLMFVQPEAERLLRERLASLPTVDVYLEHEAVLFEHSSEQVQVTFDTSDGKKFLEASWLIGCDGANSPTRSWMGTTQTDLEFSEHYVVVDAWITRDTPLPPRTTQYCNPQAPTSYVVCSDNLRRWELKILPDEDPKDFEDFDKIKQRLAPFVDVNALKFWRSSVYHFDAKVADTWRSERCFLSGDAAHTMPPFLGQGLNSGLRDAGNLAWKLSNVLDGGADPSILETYESERRPHILQLTEITKELGQIVGETDIKKATERDKRLRAEMVQTGPVTVRQALIPPLTDGFFDLQSEKLAGTLAPQPKVLKENQTFLLDDLSSGFTAVKLTGRDKELEITINFETDAPSSFLAQDTEGLMCDLLNENKIEMLIVRPDGYIWSAGNQISKPDLKAIR